MTTINPKPAFVVRRCKLWDVGRLSALAKVCWHGTYDRILGEPKSLLLGRRAYSKFNQGYWVLQSLASRASTMLLATQDDVPAGYAMAQADADEVILYSLYVHPHWQGKGIGSALLDAVTAAYPNAKAVRLEVLRGNTAAIAWYQAKGFNSYGDTPRATGTADVPSVYMDKSLVAEGCRAPNRGPLDLPAHT
jgi:GNAT superfamily N-acetyltransferase